jgi:hypothetical protein
MIGGWQTQITENYTKWNSLAQVTNNSRVDLYTYDAIVLLTESAYRTGLCFSSWFGTITGKNFSAFIRISALQNEIEI